MYYFHIERIKKDESIKEMSIEKLQDKTLIIPLFNPSTKVAEYLTDEINSSVMDIKSGVKVDIIYIDKGNNEKYFELVRYVFESTDSKNRADINDPCIVVFIKELKTTLAITLPDENDVNEFKLVIFGLINALSKPNPTKHVKTLMTIRKMKYFTSNNFSILAFLEKLLP